MEPRRAGWRIRADAVTSWWGSLDARDNRTLRATRPLPAALVLAAVALSVAMALPWHHLMVPAEVYSGPPTTVVVNGINASSWLLMIAAVEVVLAIRTYVAASSAVVKWVVTGLAFVSVMGMFGDYIDWSLRGVSLTVKAYYGPGFFLALGGAVLAVVAAGLAWRVPD
jgi:hypothetical protein